MRKFVTILAAISMLFILATTSAQAELVPVDEELLQRYRAGTSVLASELGLLPMKFTNPPSLQARVDAGELPDIAERLPADPVVVIPYHTIGRHGGTWNLATIGPEDGWSFFARHAGLEGLIRFDPTEGLASRDFHPNVAREWEVTEGGRVFTFRIHEGIRWSDGEPLTAKDIAFWYEDVILNTDLTPTVPRWLRPVGAPPAKFEMLDDYTVRFTFEEPFAFFMEQLAGPEGNAVFGFPKHWASQFHGDYADPDQLNALVSQHGFNHWSQLFHYMLGRGFSSSQIRPGEPVPTIRPFQITVPFGQADYVEFQRNPFFWKVDPAGNQLPYIDRLHARVAENSQVIALMAVAGEIGFQYRNIPRDAFPVLVQNQERGDYHAKFRADNFVHNVLTCGPNLHHRDPAKRAVFNEVDFRRALSIAIDREEIIEIMYPGQPVRPSQLTAPEGWGAHHAEWANAYIEHDPEKANRLLDELGMERGAGGFRTWQGQPFSFTLEAVSGEMEHVDLAEMVVHYWQNIGLNVSLQTYERATFFNRVNALDFDWGCWHGLFTQAQFEHFAPMGVGTIFHAAAEQIYARTGGESGAAPEGDVLRTLELWNQMSREMDPAVRDNLFLEIQDIHLENVWHISLVTNPGSITVIRNYMQNVPEEFRVAWMNIQPSTLELAQIWISE